MGFKKSFQWLIFILVMISALFVIMNKFSFPVPDDINTVQDFVSCYPVFNNITDKFKADFQLEDMGELYAATIGSGNERVLLAAIRFKKNASAGLFYNKYKSVSTGNLKVGLFDINIPWFFNFWTVKTRGLKYYSWRKGNWVIIVNGENSKRVNEIVEGFKSFVQ